MPQSPHRGGPKNSETQGVFGMARERAVLVGAGGISGAWFGPLIGEKVHVVGVVDINIENARNRVARFELDCEIGTDLKAMLKKTRPDFVVDCTTPEAHCPVTCAALRAGCHVVGEKPMASSMASARRMVRTSEQTGRMYMVSQSRRWSARHDVVRRAVTGGKIGNVTTINCDFYIGAHFGGFRAEMLRFLRIGATPQTECHDNVKSLAMVFGAMESAQKRTRVELRF